MPISFKATAPPLVDARHTTKSYMIAYELIKFLGPRNPESVVEVSFKNDKGLLKDLATWCETTGNELLSSEPSENGEDMRCLIQKTKAMDRRGSLVTTGDGIGVVKNICVLISSADLDNSVTKLEKALAGAVMGMSVNAYFVDSGVLLLRNGYRARVSGVWGRFFTPKFESGIEEKGGLLPGEAIQILQELGAQLYVSAVSLEEYGVREEEGMAKNCIIASTMTWVDLMARSDLNVV